MKCYVIHTIIHYMQQKKTFYRLGSFLRMWYTVTIVNSIILLGLVYLHMTSTEYLYVRYTIPILVLRYIIHAMSCFVFDISFIIHPTLYIAYRDTDVSERTIYELEQLSFNYDTNITPFWDS